MPVSVVDPMWDQFSELLPKHPAVSPAHPLGGHRRRIPDRVGCDHVIDALVHSSNSERIASAACGKGARPG